MKRAVGPRLNLNGGGVLEVDLLRALIAATVSRSLAEGRGGEEDEGVMEKMCL